MKNFNPPTKSVEKASPGGKLLFQQFFSVFLALMLSIGALAMPASAASPDIIDPTQTGIITIHKYDMSAAQQAGVDLDQFTATGEQDAAAETKLSPYAIQGVQFSYEKVANITTYSESGNAQLVYNPVPSFRDVLGLDTADAVTTMGGEYYYSSDQMNDALASLLENNTEGKNALEAWAAANGAQAMAETDANGTTSSGELEQGLYMVVETAVPEDVFSTTNPFLVSLPMTDVTGDYWVRHVHIYPKNQNNSPILNKLVSEDGTYGDTATASEGDTLSYRLVSQLPTITSTATYLSQYTYVDELSKGLSYNRDASVSFYNNQADAENATGTPVAVWTSNDAPAMFTDSYETISNGSRLTVAPTAEGFKEINTKYSDLFMVVSYTANASSSADMVLGDDGNPNDVKLTYSRTNNIYSNTLEDEAIVYSYGINLNKSFSDGQGDASKVQFVLQNASDNYYVTADGANGTYYVKGQAADEQNGTVFSPNSDGSLVINGLEADTFTLTEIQTDAGYSLLRDSITIEINSTDTTILATKAAVTGIGSEQAELSVILNESASAAVDSSETAMSESNGSANALVDMNILNTKTFLLPATGGQGTAVLTICGVLGAACGVFLLMKSKRSKNTDLAA